MTWRDIIGLSFRNLYRRKSRTLLTVSGVVIGCCAVVIMISLGIGMKKSQEQMLAGMGNLMRITVTSAPQNVTKRSLLDKKGVNKIRKLQNIKSVVPKKVMELGELNLIAGDQARYQCGYVTVVGIPEKDLEDAGYIIKDGKKLTGRPGEVLAGEHLAYQFTDSRRPEGKNMVDYWSDEKAQPYFPILENDIEVAQKNEEKTENSGEGESQGKTSWKTLHKLKTVGVIKQDYDKGEETDSGIIMGMRDFERLQKELRKVVNTKNSREYSQVLVDVDDISHVETVEKEIKKLGYQTSSMESLRKPMEESVKQKQMMLAGLGAVSLFVAAIGIANTMIMSIVERTREIGILKALGCSLSDIRKEFLIEAGMIGFIGGLAGSLVSCGVSWIMNTYMGASLTGDSLAVMMNETASGAALSVIPPWLIGAAVLFSVVMGVGAGFFPANRAVKISALEAMKT